MVHRLVYLQEVNLACQLPQFTLNIQIGEYTAISNCRITQILLYFNAPFWINITGLFREACVGLGGNTVVIQVVFYLINKEA